MRDVLVASQANHLPRLPTSEGAGQSKESTQKSMVKGLFLGVFHVLPLLRLGKSHDDCKRRGVFEISLQQWQSRVCISSIAWSRKFHA